VRGLIDQQAEAYPDTAFLISPETGRRVTYKELQEHSRHLYGRFRQLGLEPGDKVAFLLDNDLSTAELFLGAMYGGFVSVPLNVRAGTSQLAYTVDHCDAKVVYVGRQYEGLMREVMSHVRRPVRLVYVEPTDESLAEETSEVKEPLPPIGPEHAALLMYTSGSTGQPKGAIHTHQSILAHGRNSVLAHKLTSKDRSLLVLPMYHINAECVTLMPTLMSGGSVVVPHHFIVSRFWDWIDEHQCTWSALVPTIISQLLDWKDPKAESRKAAFDRIRFLRSSSAPLSPSLHREFLEKFRLYLIQAMGCTELGNIFSNPMPPGKNQIGSPGLPWGIETKIVNRDGVEVASGEPGEVLLRGDAMMQGYYKDPLGTAAALDTDGWLHTGDLAYRDEDGYFFVVGRSKELVIKGGMNIAPKQIDEVLEAHPAVLEAAAVGVPDRYVGEDLVAFAVLRDGAQCQEKDLLFFCESHLGHFKTPTRIYFVPDLPKGPSGKIQRLRLVEEATKPTVAKSISLVSGQGTAPANGHGTPNNGHANSLPLEEIITGIWSDLFSKPNIDPQSNFFALGGHSLLAIQCLSRLREKVPVILSLSDFFENATVVQLAAVARARLMDPSAQEATDQLPMDLKPIPLRNQTLPCPLSPAQERLWFVEQLNAGAPVYNEAEAVRLEGKLDIEALEKALNLIVARHEILRSTIQDADSKPTAMVHEGWQLKLKQIDLHHLSAEQREAEVEHLLVDEPRHPYQLQAEPGIRATIIKLGPDEHIFILMMHHLICDWSSEGVLWRELSASYRDLLRGITPTLPPLTIQHGDYAAWQKQQMTEGVYAKDLNYWETTLRDAPGLLELPGDRARPATITHRGARKRYRIGAELVKALRDCSRNERISLFTLFTSVADILLYRYTGSEDISLGIPLADRDHRDLQSVIGFLLHVHVLRTKLSGELTFRELLARVQKGALDLYAHRSPPFDQVVSRVQPERSMSYSPLFQVMMNWRDRDQQLSFIGMEGLKIESLLAETHTSKFDLTFMLTDDEDEIWLELEYSTDLFDEDRIDRMAGHYRTLLDAVAANPNQKLADLPLLTSDERKQISEWNDTHAEYPKDKCLHEVIEEQAARQPDAVAVVLGQRQLTYRELNERANQLARHLKDLGVGADSLVGICVERSLEMVIGLLGILKAGGAYVPLDPEYPRERLAFMLEDSALKVLLSQDHLVKTLPVCNARLVRLDTDWATISKQDRSNLPNTVAPANVAYVIYTSGSTGKPKGVQIPHGCVINFLESMRKAPGLTAEDTLLAITTLSFDIAGLELWLPMMVGARVVIASRETAQDGHALAELLASCGATIMQATPSTWRLLLAVGWKGSPRLKILCGGEPWPGELAEQLLERCASLWNMYGPTETTIWSAVSRIKSGEEVLIGKPIDNTQFYIVDTHLQPVPVGVPGELCIAGDGLARGYLNRPELTAERFPLARLEADRDVRIYRTGDLVCLRSNGRIEFLRRLDYQVKLRGYRIELGEIESVLRRHPNVREAAVAIREYRPDDKRLVAYVVSHDKALNLSGLREHLQGQLPDYMVPAAFVALEKLPLTPNGKVDRNALPKPELAAPAEISAAPGTPTEIVLAKIWQEVLDVKQVDINDNFFKSGGHSLLAIQLIRKISKSLNINLPVPIFFQNPTIKGLAGVLDREKQDHLKPKLVQLQPGNSTGTLFLLDTNIGLCRLAQHMENSGPAIYGTAVRLHDEIFRAAMQNRTDKLPGLREMAAVHAALIRDHRPAGPCFLGGHSFGGLLAFEVAHQLKQQGVPVNAVFVLDTWVKAPAPQIPPWWKRLKGLTFARVKAALKTRSEKLWSKVAPVAKPAPDLDEKNQPVDDSSWEVWRRIFQNARNGYELHPLDSRAILFRTQHSEMTHFYDEYSDLGWGGLFHHGLRVIETPGDHVSLLKEPQVLTLANRFQECLEELSASNGLSTPNEERISEPSTR
jgi:amino acid adenylation domain-containing protein